MNSIPRVAFFTDSFHEINGVAHTSRHFDGFVRRRGLPFLNVHAGSKTQLMEDGPVHTLELERSRFGFSLEQDMSFDLLFLRHRRLVTERLKSFGAELVHITGPSDVGMLGAALAYDLKLIPSDRPFDAVRAAHRIDLNAQKQGVGEDFSRLIREGLEKS